MLNAKNKQQEYLFLCRDGMWSDEKEVCERVIISTCV